MTRALAAKKAEAKKVDRAYQASVKLMVALRAASETGYVSRRMRDDAAAIKASLSEALLMAQNSAEAAERETVTA